MHKQEKDSLSEIATEKGGIRRKPSLSIIYIIKTHPPPKQPDKFIPQSVSLVIVFTVAKTFIFHNIKIVK